jgi:hypothetical protein
MNTKQKALRSENERKNVRDLLRRYIEKDVSGEEIRTVHRCLQESEEYRRDYEKVENYLSTLKSLPTFTPPERVWQQIEKRIERIPQRRVWFPWLYTRPTLGFAAKIVPALFLAAAVLGIGNTLLESNYEFVVVDEANGFRIEAESYVVYHDLANEPALMRESLLAFCTNTGSE